ncbi:MAG: hypothetical protein ACE5F7_10835, partial [Nitrospiria bacterium]
MSRRAKASALFFASFHAFLLLPLAPLWAQSSDFPAGADLFAPVIQHQPPEDLLPPEEDYKLTAKVTDDVGVKEVVLYYRVRGAARYSSTNMTPTGKGGYAAVVPREDISEPGIEYYIQASDEAGNIAQRAFPFSPLTIDVAAAPAPIPPVVQKEKILTDEILPPGKETFALSTEAPLEPEPILEKKPWYKKWWVWTIALAVVGG